MNSIPIRQTCELSFPRFHPAPAMPGRSPHSQSPVHGKCTRTTVEGALTSTTVTIYDTLKYKNATNRRCCRYGTAAVVARHQRAGNVSGRGPHGATATAPSVLEHSHAPASADARYEVHRRPLA